MSYIFLLEQGEESSAECFSDIPASVLSNGISTPANASSPDNGTDACHASRSGMTCKPSTANLGAGASMSSAGDFRAKTSAQPERAQESTANAPACGARWPESFARWDRDSCSWKTPQCSLLAGLDEFSETWPRWGIMQNGECWALTTSGHLISATECGFVPTPIKSDGDGGVRNLEREITCYNLRDWWAEQGLGRKRQQRKPEFWEWMMGWPMAWTDLHAAATDKFRQWRLSHSKSFPLVLANNVI